MCLPTSKDVLRDGCITDGLWAFDEFVATASSDKHFDRVSACSSTFLQYSHERVTCTSPHSVRGVDGQRIFDHPRVCLSGVPLGQSHLQDCSAYMNCCRTRLLTIARPSLRPQLNLLGKTGGAVAIYKLSGSHGRRLSTMSDITPVVSKDACPRKPSCISNLITHVPIHLTY